MKIDQLIVSLFIRTNTQGNVFRVVCPGLVINGEQLERNPRKYEYEYTSTWEQLSKPFWNSRWKFFDAEE